MEGRVISLTGDRKRSTKTGGVRRWITGALAAAVVAGTALVASPAGAATPPQINLVTGFQGTATVTVGHPKVASTAQISPSFVAYNATTGDQAVASTVDGSTFVYLIAGANATSGEYGVATGALTAGDAYVVAGNGTAGLVADPGDSADPLATDNPISPTSVNFDNNGNLIISGSFGSDAAAQQATQVVAKTTGTFYGVAMTAGDLYTLAGTGVVVNSATSVTAISPAGTGNGDGHHPERDLDGHGGSVHLQRTGRRAGLLAGGLRRRHLHLR